MRTLVLVLVLMNVRHADAAVPTAAALAPRFKARDDSVLAEIKAAGAAAVPALVELLEDQDVGVAGGAAASLAALGEVAGAAAAPLGRKLKHPDPRMRGL